VVRDG
jgi:hypothetical protein